MSGVIGRTFGESYLRYCPRTGGNVVVRDILALDGTRHTQCLNKYSCEQQGGCTEKLFRVWNPSERK